ncbi:MAG TPA: OmpA family protein [Geobacterales bacterium]|nr:OmpA family protein [Geobacterales bacterium]
MKTYFILLMLVGLCCPRASPAQQRITPEDMINALKGSGAGPGMSLKKDRDAGANPDRSASKERGGGPLPGNSLTKERIISLLGGDAPQSGDGVYRGLVAKLQKKEKDRSFTIKDREEVEIFSTDRPKISIEIYFDYNSADITSAAKSMLDTLGSALRDPQLAGTTFIFRGHTDARGDANYNLQLSDRRAVAVKNYIVRSFKVDESTIASIGDGSRHLKNEANPFADENRRVEVVRSN